MLNGGQYPAEECWAPAKHAGQKALWMDCRGQPKDQDFLGKYKSGHVSGETSRLYCILLYCITLLGGHLLVACLPSSPVGRGAQQAGKHWKVLGVPGKRLLAGAEPSWGR